MPVFEVWPECWLLPLLAPVGVLGEEEEGDVDCEELPADWQQLLLWYEESIGDRFLAALLVALGPPKAPDEGVVGEFTPALY